MRKYELVTQGRNLRRAGNMPAAKKVKYVFNRPTPAAARRRSHQDPAQRRDLGSLAAVTGPQRHARPADQLGELFLPLEGHIDVAAEKVRLAKEMEKIEAEIVKVEQKLANPNFTQKVRPPSSPTTNSVWPIGKPSSSIPSPNSTPWAEKDQSTNCANEREFCGKVVIKRGDGKRHSRSPSGAGWLRLLSGGCATLATG